MNKTICLYEYPAAVRDIKGWEDFMDDKGKLLRSDWSDDKHPIFNLRYGDGKEIDEVVYCIPLSELVNPGYTPDFSPQKIVIIGAIHSDVVTPLSQLLESHKSSFLG